MHALYLTCPLIRWAAGAYPVHLGNFIRRLSTASPRCDSSQYCSDVISNPGLVPAASRSIIHVHHVGKGPTTMSIVAHAHPFVVGVDTHARKHVYTILIASTGAFVGAQDFPTTAAGINRAIAWVARHTGADVDTLWVIEGAASYGAILTGTVATHGYPVAEAPRMDTKQHYGVGKSDTLDAHRIAAAALPLPVGNLRRPRLNGGVRQAIRILITARDALTTDRTRTVNALSALLRTNELGVDARKALTKTPSVEVSTWRSSEAVLALSLAHGDGSGEPKRIVFCNRSACDNEPHLAAPPQASPAAPLLGETGGGRDRAARWHPPSRPQRRVRTAAVFA